VSKSVGWIHGSGIFHEFEIFFFLEFSFLTRGFCSSDMEISDAMRFAVSGIFAV